MPKPFKVYPQTEEELRTFEMLRMAYGFKTLRRIGTVPAHKRSGEAGANQ